MKQRFKKNVELLPVEGVPKVGQKYHIVWATSRGMVWTVVEVNEKRKTVLLRTPKTKRVLPYFTYWRDLRHLRKTQAKLIQNAIKQSGRNQETAGISPQSGGVQGVGE